MLPLLLFFFSSAAAVFSKKHAANTVKLSYGTFQGTSMSGMDSFLGIPYAEAERFALPQTPKKLPGVQNASAFGAACPQQPAPLPDIPGFPPPNASVPLTVSENCLFVNVIRPSQLPPHYKLPVLFWLFGGGFGFGDSSQLDGSTVVARSIALEEPVIYVSINYRVNLLGFIASKEVKDRGVGNLGLQDQRFALKWVRENIAHFGGDPNKVTIWGESAGAISVGLHLVLNHGHTEGLFRGAVMESGSPIPLPDITTGQPFYDQLVADTNCTYSEDTFSCLKTVSLEVLQNAVNKSPNSQSFSSLNLAWQPRVDGKFITENAQDSVAKGAYAKVPLISGDCDDEGTLFSLSTLNLTTDQEAMDYIHFNYYPLASDEEIQQIGDLYPSDPTQGSPFDTGTENQLSPQFKRLAAVQGDAVFQAPRRFFLQSASKTQSTWAFLYKRGKATPIFGSGHTSDIPEFYGAAPALDFQGTDALINFANNLDPNHGSSNVAGNLSTLIYWPKYSTNTTAPPLLTFLDPNTLTITPDTYRAAGMSALTRLSREFP